MRRGSMPLVTLTPRVRVRRMWTPSRMLLASSVRPDLLGDLVVRGDRGEGEGLGAADEPVEVLGEAEDAPVVEAEPLPHGVAPCTDESNGLIAALSRWTSSPLILTRRSRFFSLKIWSMVEDIGSGRAALAAFHTIRSDASRS